MIDPTTIAAVISCLGLILVARVKLTGDRDSARGPDWQAYSDSQRKDLEELKKEVREVRGEVSTLRAEVSTLRSKFLAALRHIYEWRRVVPPERWPSTPPELVEDLAPPPDYRP